MSTVILRTAREFNCPSADAWKNKMWFTQTTMEYYSTLKRNEALICVILKLFKILFEGLVQ